MLLKCFRGAQDFIPVLLRLPLLGSPPGHVGLKGWWGSEAVVTAFSCLREPVLLMSLCPIPQFVGTGPHPMAGIDLSQYKN